MVKHLDQTGSSRKHSRLLRLLNMYNACLTTGTFRKRWKWQQVRLIEKRKGDDNPTYRPLCMLDTAGKLLEKLIRPRLLEAIQEAGGLSPRQYSFTENKSIDAVKEVTSAVMRALSGNYFSRNIVVLVTLDFKNAFNSLRWNEVLYALEHRFHVPEYLLCMV